jgi:hypothetical protein
MATFADPRPSPGYGFLAGPVAAPRPTRRARLEAAGLLLGTLGVLLALALTIGGAGPIGL